MTTAANYDEFYFQSGEVMNYNEQIITDILETILGRDRYYFYPQIPLSTICDRSETGWLENKIWKFWVGSKVDITVLERGFGASRKAKLVVECQSHFHDSPEAMERDRIKAELLESVGVPLIYTRSVDEDRRFIRFFTPDGETEVFYNPITQDGRTELEAFLTAYL